MNSDPNCNLLEKVQKELQKVDLKGEVPIIKELPAQEINQAGAGAGPSSSSSNVNPTPTPIVIKTHPIDLTPPVTESLNYNPGTGKDGKQKLASVIIMLGMAGSGKTSWTQRFGAYLLSENKKSYNINLDPGCRHLPFPVNIDIRDTVDWKELMKKYRLGPNGAMVTALNLFSLKFTEVLGILEVRAKEYDYILIDTPGQMECFLWSASGSFITQGLAHRFPTTLIYVMDLTRSISPVTFSSSMLNALSILYKNQLPLIVALNKVDVNPFHAKRVAAWTKDYVEFEADLSKLNGKPPYGYTLASSIALRLDEFYKLVPVVLVSAKDGYGVKDFVVALDGALDEYNKIYIPLINNLRERQKKKMQDQKKQDLAKLIKDMKSDNLTSTSSEDLFTVPASNEAIHGIDLLDLNTNNEDFTDSSCTDEDNDNEDDKKQDELDFRGIHDQEVKKRKERMERQMDG